MRAGIRTGTYMGNGEQPRCRSPPEKAAFFSLEKHIHVLYNGEYEMNKKGRTERVAALSAPMQVPQPPTSINTMRPIPILLEIPLFINTESGDLGSCAVLYGGVGK